MKKCFTILLFLITVQASSQIPCPPPLNTEQSGMFGFTFLYNDYSKEYVLVYNYPKYPQYMAVEYKWEFFYRTDLAYRTDTAAPKKILKMIGWADKVDNPYVGRFTDTCFAKSLLYNWDADRRSLDSLDRVIEREEKLRNDFKPLKQKQ
jgi:hypothetical protein